MNKSDRRAFLKAAALGGVAAMAPLGCSEQLPEAPAETNAAAPDDGVTMAIAKWQGEEDPAGDLSDISKRVTEEAIRGMGGMERFVRKGDVVFIKPNIAIHAVEQFAANTNPHVVATLARLCFEAGAAKVQVGDNSAYDARKAYPMSGIEQAAEAAGCEVVYFEEGDFEERPVNGEFLKEWPVAVPMMEADLLINVPIVKHHALAGVSIGMKNLMGVAGGDRRVWHPQIATCLTDISAYAKPRLNVMDAIRALVRHGPKGGDMKDVKFAGLVAASTDIVAMDAAGTEIIGLEPARILTLREGYKRGLGELDFRSLNPKQLLVS